LITHQLKPLPLLVAIALVITLGLAALPAHIALGACPTTLSLTLINDPHLLVDSNNPAIGPQVTTAYATITNTGAATAYDVYMYIGNGITPGTFAAGSDGQKLSMLGSVGDATRFIGNLAPGESKTVYWMLKYPLTYGKTYPMTIWASNSAECLVQGSHTFTTQSSISAAADKILGMVTLDPADGQVHVGNILTVTVTGFNFGVIGSNGDAWLQPVGNLDFNPDQFRLIKTETYIHSLAGQCGYPSMPVYDRSYFPGIRTCYSFNAADYVKYYFVAISEGTTTAKLYQEAASGAQEKYSRDYGTPGATVTFTAHCGGITLWKSVNPQTATANTTLTWTITYTNDTDLPIGDPGTGNGLTVREDAIPANTTYVANSATCSGNCTIYYSTDNGATWNTTEPAPSQLTNIKWFINQVIPAGSSGTVSFQTKVNSDVIDAPLICNTASAGVGDCPFAPTDTVCANGGADLDLIKVVNDHSPCEGGDITYTVTVSNPSTINATGVQVTDLLPSGLTYLSSSTSQGTYNNTTGLWNVGNLTASTSATLTLTARVNTGTGGTTIINSGNITHSEQTDPVLLNNSDHDGITVHAAPAAYPASNSPVCVGATIYLFGGPGGMTSYYWTGPGGFTSNEQNPVRPNATFAMAGTYNLTVVDFNGCGSASNVTNVAVNTKPTATASSNSPVPEGATIQLYGGPAGMTSYSWTGPGGWASDDQNPIRTGATTAMAGTYTLTVSNGCTDDESTSVTVNTPVCCTHLMISSTEGGSVTTPGEGEFPYVAGTVVDLVASPDPGYKFVNWSGDVATIADVHDASTTITMSGWYSITASFEAEEVPTPVYPTVTTQAATTITTDSATLNMSYTVGNFSSVQVRFACKRSTDSAWSYTAWVSKGADGTHAEPLTGLISQTEYEFKAQLKYNGTVIDGNTLQFTTATPSTPPPSEGCFIATAAYGTPTAEQIDVLREFRDIVLLESTAGSQFVALYYQLSPPVADFIAGNELLRTLVRELVVNPIVWVVEATGDIWRN